MIAGFVTDDTLRDKYRCSRQEYVSCPPNIRRKFRGYVRRKNPRLTLPQFRLMVVGRHSGP